MTQSFSSTPISDADVARYGETGFHVSRGLFDVATVGRMNDHFDRLHDELPAEQYSWTPDAEDPLDVYPRMMMPHRFDPLAKEILLDARVLAIVGALLDDEPLAAQSMYYWKPPGSRGQELHQDNFYLKVQPFTCMASWTALDHCDAGNGGLKVVPNTHVEPLHCPEPADLAVSFTNHYVQPDSGAAAIQLDLAPGDTLFFNGNVIHGSDPNRSPDRFRRAFICHYLPAAAEEIAQVYFPVLDRNGEIVEKRKAGDGGPCGDVEPVPAVVAR